MDSDFHKPTMTYQLWDESVKQGNTELIQPYSHLSVSKMRLHLEKKIFFLVIITILLYVLNTFYM